MKPRLTCLTRRLGVPLFWSGTGGDRMRIILCLLLLLTPVWAKAQSTAFDDAMAGLDKVFEDGGDPDRIYQYLTQTVRTSRALGRNEPDFAIFYAMLADHLRNVELNPVYALQVAEEGLGLIAGDPAQSDFATILQVTRSYALADLGRLDEAYRQAQLILPTYGALFNQDTVADYAQDAETGGGAPVSTPPPPIWPAIRWTGPMNTLRPAAMAAF